MSDGSEGLICKACNLGFSHVSCQSPDCNALISAKSFGSKCFIATELYGADSGEVAILRRLRDRVLLKSRPGRVFVAGYYRIAPEIIPVMRRSRVLPHLFHAIVGLLVVVVRRTSLASTTTEMLRVSATGRRVPACRHDSSSAAVMNDAASVPRG